MASASTQGTPPWLLRLEQAREQLKDDNYITWLLTKGKEHGIPDDIIDAQLMRSGYEVIPKEVKPEPLVKEVVEPKVERVQLKPKAGRPRKQ